MSLFCLYFLRYNTNFWSTLIIFIGWNRKKLSLITPAAGEQYGIMHVQLINTKSEECERIELWEILELIYRTVCITIHNIVSAFIPSCIHKCRIIQIKMCFCCLWEIRKDLTVMLWECICLPLEGGIYKVNWVVPHKESFVEQVLFIKVLEVQTINFISFAENIPLHITQFSFFFFSKQAQTQNSYYKVIKTLCWTKCMEQQLQYHLT